MCKTHSITTLLASLDLEQRGWTIVDNWDADNSAVGIAKKSEPRRLVYVTCWGKEEGRFDYDCDVVSEADGFLDETIEQGKNVTLDEVQSALRRHLDT